MKSMTIHGIDEHLEKLIRLKAEAEGLSINKTIKKLLETALGVKPRTELNNLDDFKEFSGLWTHTDLKEFEAATTDTRTIDLNDWK
jgi:hypothetical protein